MSTGSSNVNFTAVGSGSAQRRIAQDDLPYLVTTRNSPASAFKVKRVNLSSLDAIKITKTE